MRTIHIRVLKWVFQRCDCEQDWWCERWFCSNVSKDAVCTKIRRLCAHPWHVPDETLSEVCVFMGLFCTMTMCRASFSKSSLHLNLGMRAGGISGHPVLMALKGWLTLSLELPCRTAPKNFLFWWASAITRLAQWMARLALQASLATSDWCYQFKTPG